MGTESQLRQYGLFDSRVPRYTSYPAASQFGNSVSDKRLREWIAAIPAGSAISLYLHVPFCRRLCWFCACRTQGTSSAAPLRAYLDDLKAELTLLRPLLPPGLRLSRLHWGGGTPTLFAPDMIEELAAAIDAVLPRAPGAEFSVEIDPNEIDAARLTALAAAGMNRASIGVQDFDPEIQRLIGRSQSYLVTRQAVDALRALGIGSLNADILFGLPRQTPARMIASVAKLLTLSPDRVALYGYAHVPWMARRQLMIATDTLPNSEERLGLFAAAASLFETHGYCAIGIDHFARPGDGLAQAQRAGRLRRNFQGYTDDSAPVLIGIGASAISRFPQGYAQNAHATSAYSGAIRAGHLAVRRGHILTDEDHLRGRIIEALMCDFEVNSAELCTRFGTPRAILDDIFAKAEAAFPGLVTYRGGRFRIAPRARVLTRMIARGFDGYDLAATGHSMAI